MSNPSRTSPKQDKIRKPQTRFKLLYINPEECEDMKVVKQDKSGDLYIVFEAYASSLSVFSNFFHLYQKIPIKSSKLKKIRIKYHLTKAASKVINAPLPNYDLVKTENAIVKTSFKHK